MRDYLRLYLIVTGVGALIAVGCPALVVVGLFLGILPGLILGVMPTAFLWGLAFAVVYRGASVALPGRVAAGLGAVVAVAAMTMLPQGGLRAARERLAAAHEAELIPAGPIPVRGHVRIEVPRWESEPGDGDRRPGPACDGLTASLLFQPGVESVTVAIDGPEPGGKVRPSRLRTFRLEPKGQGDLKPLTPGPGRILTPNHATQRLVEAGWRLRLSVSDRIAVEDDRAPAPDLVIRQRSTSASYPGNFAWGDDGVESQTTEILDGRETLLLRRRGAWTRAVAAPLIITGAGGLETFRMGWSRAVLKDGETQEAGDLVRLLLRHTDAEATADPAATLASVRDRLAAALGDPKVPAGDPIFDAADIYFDALKKAGATPKDEALVLSFLADPRVVRPNGVWAVGQTAGIDRGRLRAALVGRLTQPDQPRRVVETFNSLLRKMPARTFATPTAAEANALGDPVARLQLPALVERIADRGPEAIDPLLAAIRLHGGELQRLSGKSAPAGQRERLETLRESHLNVVNAAIQGLRRLGRGASEALPELESMRAEGLFRSSGWAWAETQAYLGKPIDQIERDSSIGNSDASFRQNLRRKVAGWDPEKVND